MVVSGILYVSCESAEKQTCSTFALNVAHCLQKRAALCTISEAYTRYTRTVYHLFQTTTINPYPTNVENRVSS